MLRCSATRAMTRTLHEPWPKPKRPPSARDPPSQSAAPPENRRVNQPETVLRVDCARWGQTPEDLRQLALSAPHARTRERALALFDITQHRCATQVAVRTGRRAHTV